MLTPSPEDPVVPTVDLEGALAGLLALVTARGGGGLLAASSGHNKKPLSSVCC